MVVDGVGRSGAVVVVDAGGVVVAVVVVVERRRVVDVVEGRRYTVVCGRERYDGVDVVVDGEVGRTPPVSAPRPGTRAFSWGSSHGASQWAPWAVKCTPSYL